VISYITIKLFVVNNYTPGIKGSSGIWGISGMLIGIGRIGFGSILRVGGLGIIAGLIPIGFVVGLIKIIGTDMGLTVTTGFLVGTWIMIGFVVGFFVGFFVGRALGFSMGLTLGGSNADVVPTIII
jgi:hypothetical protein